jgi:hypothetical protein
MPWGVHLRSLPLLRLCRNAADARNIGQCALALGALRNDGHSLQRSASMVHAKTIPPPLGPLSLCVR